ncbi:M24 family metallopeptidase [Candidatus Bipolaricaulota bacterium]|nr:M24 family metallopeptidase [Candidatus Bipolaricaulota bacterium]
MVDILNYDQLKKDVQRRIKNVQSMMKRENVEVLIIVGAGAPGSIGALRYITNAHLWEGRAFGVLGADDPEPWVEIRSSYQAEWTRNETTTKKSRVESPQNLISRTSDLARDYITSNEEIGFVNLNNLLSVGEYNEFYNRLEGYKLRDVTSEFNSIRQVKTPFEIEAIERHGELLDRGIDVFRNEAKIGKRYWDVCASVENFIKSRGSFWGRTKLSLDVTPFTVPPPKNKKMKENNIINFEIVYESPWGYWGEITTVFSFHNIPEETKAILDGYLKSVKSSSPIIEPGSKLESISDKNDETFEKLGFSVVGKHTPDCHSTGLDGTDGPDSLKSPNFELKKDMVLCLHPGALVEDGKGFLVSDNFLVTPEGGKRLSPHTQDRYYLRIGQ